MRRRPTGTRGLCLALMLLCPAALAAQRRTASGEPAAMREIVFTATDDGITGPDTVSAQVAVVKLVNRGHEVHEMQWVRLEDQWTLERALEVLRRDGKIQRPTDFGIGPVLPGQTGIAIYKIDTQTRYLLLDFHAAPDGTPWWSKGLRHWLVVRDSLGGDSPVIRAEAGLNIVGSSFRFGNMLKRGNEYVLLEGRQRMAELRRGDNVIQVETTGSGHQVVVMRADSPEAARRYYQWLSGNGRMPDGIVGGLSALPTTRRNFRLYLRMHFEHGTYIVFCPTLHSRTGLPGFRTGEFAQFVVR
jgi:hypothetical protein